MKKITILGGALVIVLIFVSTLVGSYIRIHDNEVKLRKSVVAQNDVCKANFDKMFKVIAQTAEVSDEFMTQARESFKEIYIPIMEGRYSNERGGALMSWVHENNPIFDLNATGNLYKNLQIVIEANRQEFFNEQKKLIDLNREYETYTERFWQKLVLGKVDTIEINIITSDNTERTFETNKDNNIKLF